MAGGKRIIIRKKPESLSTDEVASRIADMDNEDELDEDEFEDEGEGETESEPVERLRSNPPPLQSSDDIFEWCEEKYVKSGIPVTYIVKKNGSLVGEFEHPCSWSMIQKAHGAGLYMVKAREGHRKTYIKQQHQHILDLPKTQEEKENMQKSEPQIIERIVEKQAAPQFDMFEMMNMFRQTQQEASEAVRLAQKEAQTAQQNMMTAMLNIASKQPAPVQQSGGDEKMMQLMLSMQQNTTQMFEKMMTMTQASINEVARNSEKMFEKLASKLENNQAKPSGLEYTPDQIMKMMQESQARGFEMWSHTERLAEHKAAQQLRVLESTKETAIEDVRPKSLTEKLVDSMLPAIAAAMTNPALMQAQMPQMPQLPQAQAQAPRQLPPPQPKKRVKPAIPTAQTQPKQESIPTKKHEVIESQTTKKDKFGFPMAQTQSQQNEEQENMFKFQRYLKIAADVLTPQYNDYVSGQKPIPEIADILLESLKAQGIASDEFLKVCPLEKITGTLKTLGADVGIINFVGEVYANLETRTAMGVGGN